VTWHRETLFPHVAASYEVDRVLYQGRSGFQDIVILENATFGRMMVLDGVTQTTERDEFIYHEMMAHVPLFAHGAASRVLIIGGGDGGLLEEVLKHPVERVTQVEIDPDVIEISKRFLPSICRGAYDDPRTDLVVGDGFKYAAETENRFDVIMVDSTDPAGPGEILFGRPFYGHCRRILNPGGILVTQNGVPFMQGRELTTSYRHFKALFADAAAYVAAVPTYSWGFMALGWAALSPDYRALDRATLERRIAKVGATTRYYNGECHLGAFMLPRYVRELLA
jgi:spermidine synthase